jgi:long-chain acyl-CoA synthetase
MTDPAPRSLLPSTVERPDDVAVTAEQGTRTFAELEERARRLAQAVRAAGIGPGQAFAVLARNRVEWPEILLGNVRARTRYVPLNWHLTVAELSDLLDDSGARLLLVGPEDEAVGREAAAAAGIRDVVVLGDAYDGWLAAHPDDPTEDGAAGSPLMYTGGTTGRSKGVTRSDTGFPVSRYAELARRWGDHVGMPEHGESLLTTPAYHALGYALVQSALVRGQSLTIRSRFDPIDTLRAIEARRVVSTVMVPTQFVRLLKLDPDIRDQFDVSSVEWVLHSAAPCPQWAKEEMIEWFGPVIVELYGSSEGTGPVVATSEEWLERPGTVGKASPALTISIVDDDGNDLPPGEIGTVYVKRHDGAPEYHGDPEKTDSIRLPDGRFTVGDVGWLDDDGFLFLADRRVDLILRAGVNVYPAEIEGVISQHPAVADVAVFGIPDDDLGQAVHAVVEPAPGATTDDEALTADVLAFARERLAPFKLPASIEVTDALPREAHGKLKKRLLRDPFWQAPG